MPRALQVSKDEWRWANDGLAEPQMHCRRGDAGLALKIVCARASLRIGVALVPHDGLASLKFYPVFNLPEFFIRAPKRVGGMLLESWWHAGELNDCRLQLHPYRCAKNNGWPQAVFLQ